MELPKLDTITLLSSNDYPKVGSYEIRRDLRLDDSADYLLIFD